MRGEHGSGPGQLDRLGERGPSRDVLPDPLETEEAGVPLVGVKHLRLTMPGDLAVQPDGPDAADAEQQFLPQPVIARPAVQPVGDLAQQRVVVLDVGVKQQQRHPADVRDPDLGGQLRATVQADHDLGRRPGLGPQQPDRQSGRVRGGVPLGLPALGRQRLGEITMPIQQTRRRSAARRGRWPTSGGHRRGCQDHRNTAAMLR